jgi:site-specific recombinase XerD
MAARRLAVVTPPAPSALDTSVSDYLASVKARGLSPKTLDHYESILRRIWLPFLAAEKVTTLAEVSQRTLDRLSSHLLDDGGARGPLSRHSVHSYLRAIGHYLKWASAQGEMTNGARSQMPRLPHRVLTVLTREQIRAMEDAAATERDKVIIRMLADTGLRLGELLGLTSGDLIEQGRDRFVKVRGKGARERLVPLQPALYARLRRYAEHGRPKDVVTDRIFITLRKNRITGDYEALATRTVQDLTRILAAKVEIRDRPTNPHAFRHAFATNCLRRGMNPIQLQRILGHQSLEMISTVYAHLAPADAAAALMAVLRSEE